MPRIAAAGEATAAAPPVIGRPRLTGRDAEVAALLGALAGPPAAVLVEGEAGIGKSRLLQECLASRADVNRAVAMCGDVTRSDAGQPQRMLVVCCPPFRQPHTLGPVADALRQAAGGVAGLRLSGLAGALRPSVPEWAADLPPAPEPAEDASAARHRVFAALAELLGRLRVDWLAAEDVHWADEATLEFLLYLASRWPQQIGLVVTYRPEDVPEDSLLARLTRHAASGAGRRIALGPLDVGATAGLMSSMLDGQRVSEEFAAFVHARTEGVPLAVEELVQLMGERGDLTRRGSEWVRRHLADIVVPPTIRDAVLERAARLGADARAVLRAAAVLAEPASDFTLAAVSGLGPGPAHEGLCAVLDCGLIAENDRGLVAFRHVLAARAVYEATPGPERRAMHLRAGLALRDVSPPPVIRLARHFREAGDTPTWRRYTEQAADNALGSGDEATAAALLHDLAISGGLPAAEVIRLVKKIPFGPAPHEARLRDLVRTLRSVLDTGQLGQREKADVRMQLGRILMVMDEEVVARAELELAIPHLAHDPVERTRAMIFLGWPRGTAWPRSAHLRWLRRAGKVPVSAAGVRMRLAVDRATALLLLGEEEGWSEAELIAGDPASPLERHEMTRGYANTAEMAMLWGRYAEARQRLALGLDLAERHQYQRYRDGMLAGSAHLDWFTGAWEGLPEQAAAVAGSTEQPVTRLQALLVIGLLHLAAGTQAGAREFLQLVLDEALQRGMVEYAIGPAAALARLHLTGRSAGDALKVTEEPIRIVAGKGTWVWATDLAPARVRALAAAGRVDEAAGLVSAFARGLRGRDAPAPKASLVLCRAILAEARGEHARAAAWFARAAAAWQALPRPYDALLARERQGHCLLGCGRHDYGFALLHQVYAGLSELGARGDALRVAHTLRRHGRDVKRQGPGRPSHGDRLSPRELDVARLLVDGRSNRDIARELFLSPKTVACHVRSSMRKLGVASRTALAVRVSEAGIVSDQPNLATAQRAEPRPHTR